MDQTKLVLKIRGGTTRCVPLCTRNSITNKNLSFYQFPVQLSTKEKRSDL